MPPIQTELGAGERLWTRKGKAGKSVSSLMQPQAREVPQMKKHVLQLFKEALRRLAIKSDPRKLEVRAAHVCKRLR